MSGSHGSTLLGPLCAALPAVVLAGSLVFATCPVDPSFGPRGGRGSAGPAGTRPGGGYGTFAAVRPPALTGWSGRLAVAALPAPARPSPSGGSPQPSRSAGSPEEGSRTPRWSHRPSATATSATTTSATATSEPATDPPAPSPGTPDPSGSGSPEPSARSRSASPLHTKSHPAPARPPTPPPPATGPYLPAIDSALIDPAPPVPAPSPTPADPAAPTNHPPVAAPDTPTNAAIAQADGLNAGLDRPHSLIWSGVLALLMATMGLLMIGRRRRQW